MRTPPVKLVHVFKLLTLAALALVPTLGVLPDAAHGAATGAARSGFRSMSSRPAEDPNGARVIVKFKALGSWMRALRASGHPERGPQLASALGARLGLNLSDGRAIQPSLQVIHGDRRLSSAALAARLAADPEVEFAAPDYRRYALTAPNDPLYAANPSISPAAGQWYLRAADATFVSAINAEAAWAVTTGSASVIVADLDTGIRPDHPDLSHKIFTPSAGDVQAGFTGPFVGWDFVAQTSNSNDGNGRDSDASDPGDWTTANQCGSGQAAESSSWHGTQTAGLIGAQTNNNLGMASIGHDVMLLPLRVLGTCGGYDSDIQAAMLWAAGIAVAGVPTNPHPAQVVNLSLGGSGSCTQAYISTIGQLTARNVVVVVAAGNDEGLAVGVPGNCAGVIAVAAVRNVGTKVGFSSIGPEVALSAPGGNCINTNGTCLYPILTTTNTGATVPATNTYSDSSNPSLGTSFATPLVAGTVALMLSANPSLTPAQINTLLQGSTRPFPLTSAGATTPVPVCTIPTATSATQDECICTPSTCGAGMLDAGAAVAAAAIGPPPAVTLSPASATVVTGSTLAFSATATAPGGRTIASYQWSLGGSPVAAFVGSTNTSQVSLQTSGTGVFDLTLTVTDSAGVKAKATAAVSVNPPAGPTISIVPSATVVPAGSAVSFDGSGTVAHDPATLVAYAWTIASQSSGSLVQFTSATNASTATVSTAANGSGSFSVQLAATDSYGQVSTSQQTVTVTPVGPTATISANATVVNIGANVTFNGGGSTPPAGRTLTGYQWAITAGSGFASFSGSTTGPSATVTANAAGTFSVTLTVTDSAGAQASRSASVTVNSPGGGGGGAMSPLWVLGVGVAAAALARTRRRSGADDAPR